MIETGEIKMPAKQMLSVLFMQNGLIWFLLGIVGIIVFIFLGVAVDPRFYILALIWLFMITPLVVAFLYFYYGMRPLTAFNSIPHKLFFSENTVWVHLISITEEGKDEECSVDKKDYSVGKDSFTGMKTGGNYVLLFFNKAGWLYLPVSSFNTVDEFRDAIKSFQV